MYTSTRQWNHIRKRILKLGESQRQVARTEGLGRRTIQKMLKYEFPPGYKGCNLQKLSSIQGDEPVNTSTACCSNSPQSKQQWMEWMYSLEQKPSIGQQNLPSSAELIAGLSPALNNSRRKALVILANERGFSISAIAKHLKARRKTVQHYLADFQSGGIEFLFGRKPRKIKYNVTDLKNVVFALLHEPPMLSGFNRTTWRLEDLHKTLIKMGYTACRHIVRAVIKDAGYRWRSARVVLTSNDPKYREKLEYLQNILSHLKNDERFFSIDEFGPFAVKMIPGRVLVEPGVHPTVPQRQKSKGWLIVTAALELSRNRVTHFYSNAKNTAEMIRMAKVLVDEYKDARVLYLSWDAASWHISKELVAFVDEHNKTCSETQPKLELAPLPASAQFLNIIESVFSGMSRAIIHNSNYPSVKAATEAIDRYFSERNQHFKNTPSRAGKKIWGLERTSTEFNAGNNCKDPGYR